MRVFSSAAVKSHIWPPYRDRRQKSIFLPFLLRLLLPSRVTSHFSIAQPINEEERKKPRSTQQKKEFFSTVFLGTLAQTPHAVSVAFTLFSFPTVDACLLTKQIYIMLSSSEVELERSKGRQQKKQLFLTMMMFHSQCSAALPVRCPRRPCSLALLGRQHCVRGRRMKGPDSGRPNHQPDQL